MLKQGLLVLILLFIFPWAGTGKGVEDWGTVKDHAIVADTQGWAFPVEIMFVPNPGPNPKDPLYYVTELRGTIKVVTNDRSVYVYQEHVNAYRPPSELPHMNAELGLAGLCLDPGTGYIFATTIYFRNGLIYNKIVRFEHETRAFGLKPEKFTEFTRIFDQDESGISHQIGKCVISTDGKLYVGVGDGHASHKAQGLDNPNGKMLRMNLDFSAPQDNPFYNPLDPHSIANYIYAYGFRNPFGPALDDNNTLYITDNGPNRDRLIETLPGKNYLWDGTNESMKGDGFWIWYGSVGPAGMMYLGKNTRFPYWQNRLVVTQGGTPSEMGPSHAGKVMLTSYPVKQGYGMQGKPEHLVWFHGNYRQLLVPAAEGPDGIYFAGMFPDPSGETTIFKLVRQEGKPSDESKLAGSQLFQARKCYKCHSVNGIGDNKGLALDGLVSIIHTRLESTSYRKQLEEMQGLQQEPYSKYMALRQQLLTQPAEASVKLWIQTYLTDPQFQTTKPPPSHPNLPPHEISMISDYLMTLVSTHSIVKSTLEEYLFKFIMWWNTDYNARPTVTFLLGVFGTLLLMGIVSSLRRRKNKRNSA
ncbi:MAG: PQQ-dependent sugar dehydrogenase [SAR324 cluster bacterium]|nr:PQQ-dependent sugar dehydrogenase [SAR324 cluster bacterium]